MSIMNVRYSMSFDVSMISFENVQSSFTEAILIFFVDSSFLSFSSFLKNEFFSDDEFFDEIFDEKF